MRFAKDSTILIVEDDDALRDSIVSDFKRKGFQVLSASGGQEAFQIIERPKVDLVISDYHMPNGNGIELLERIKNKDAAFPVFIFTGGKESDLSPEEIYE